MSAEVGLLTRNVKIYGKTYDLGQGQTMEMQGFGGRVLVGSYGSDDAIRKGERTKLPDKILHFCRKIDLNSCF